MHACIYKYLQKSFMIGPLATELVVQIIARLRKQTRFSFSEENTLLHARRNLGKLGVEPILQNKIKINSGTQKPEKVSEVSAGR